MRADILIFLKENMLLIRRDGEQLTIAGHFIDLLAERLDLLGSIARRARGNNTLGIDIELLSRLSSLTKEV